MHRPARTRRTLAAATAFGIAAGLCGVGGAATPAVADEPASNEIVVPDPGRYTPREEILKHAGATGYAHKQEGVGTVWTDYATGTDSPLTAEQAGGHSGLSAAIGTEPFDQPRTVTVSDLAAGAQKAITIPAGQVWAKVYNADTTVSYAQDGTGRLVSLSLWQAAAEGAPVERPVRDLPDATGPLVVIAQDTKGAVLRIRTGETNRLYLLDHASATLTQLPDVISPSSSITLGERHVVAHASFGKELHSVPRATPAASPVATPLPAPTGSEGPGTMVSVVGDTLLFQRTLTSPENGFERGNAVRAIPIGGGTVTDVLWRAQEDGFAVAPDGSVLVAGGTKARDWALHRITAGADGVPHTTVVRKIPQVPATYQGIALGGGRLSYLADTESYDMTGLYDVDTNVVWAPAAKLRTKQNVLRPGLASLGDGDTVFAQGNALLSPIVPGAMRIADLPGPGDVVDGAGRYVLARSGDTTWVADLEDHSLHTPDVELTLTDSAAALWDTKVWKPAATAGQVNSYDLRTKATSTPLDLGSGCKPTELQAVGRWLYWACGADKAGVYDHTSKKSVPVPTGEALLGDGFVVRHEGDKLRLTDAGTGQTTDFADLPASASGSGRRTTWTVDKFGGGVAYVDAESDIHVKRVDIAPQPMASLDSSVPPVLSFDGHAGAEPAVTWSPVWRFSRPVGSWSLVVTDRHGQTVRSTGGGSGKGAAVAATWNGEDTRGRGLADGDYTWSLRVLPVGGVVPADERTLTGTVRLEGSSLTTLRSTYQPLTPTRLMDTRSGLGVPQGKLGPGGWARLKVTGVAGVPSTTVTAVVLNVTATNATAGSFVSVYPDGTERTSASNLNFKAGQTVPNLVTVPVVNGHVDFFNKNGDVDLIADIAGFYSDRSGGSTYQPVTPNRLMDTRTGIGVPKAKVGAGRTVTLPVTEPGATAVVLNVTATNPTAGSFVSVYPYGTERTAASNLNFVAGQTVPNLVVVPVKDGRVTFYNRAGTVDLIADVAGYFKTGSGSLFTGMQPKRLLDTRDGTGVPKAKIGAGQTVTLTVGTKYTAVVLNVTATNPTAASFVSVYPYGTQRTAASNLNFVAGQTVPNLVVVPVRNGRVTFYNRAGTVDLIADISGYYTG
ncbi:FlgD immunoglobulin-like domain containing protein [Streptomyces sp. NPDC003027]